MLWLGSASRLSLIINPLRNCWKRSLTCSHSSRGAFIEFITGMASSIVPVCCPINPYKQSARWGVRDAWQMSEGPPILNAELAVGRKAKMWRA